MKIYLLSILLLAGFSFYSCNGSNVKTTDQNVEAKPAPEVNDKPLIRANPEDTITAQPGDRIYMNNEKIASNFFDLPNDFFDKKWLRSSSEDEELGGEVYRPEGFETLEPARFTPTFIFSKDKTCQYLKRMKNDAHEMENAMWAYNINKQLRIFKKSEGGRAMLHNWVVNKATKDILVIESRK